MRLPRLIGESRALDMILTGKRHPFHATFDVGFDVRRQPPQRLGHLVDLSRDHLACMSRFVGRQLIGLREQRLELVDARRRRIACRLAGGDRTRAQRGLGRQSLHRDREPRLELRTRAHFTCAPNVGV